MPCIDFCTDLVYLLAQPFYKAEVFALCLIFVSTSWFHFIYYLVQLQAHPKMWLFEMPSCLFFAKYDSIFKLTVTALAYFVFLILNGNILLLFVGGLLYATKVMTISSVSNAWFYCWTGGSKYEQQTVFNSALFNELLYGELVMESLPQFIVQLLNTSVLHHRNYQRFNATSIVSIVSSAVSVLNGLYRLVYLRLYHGVNLKTLPADLTLGGLIPSNGKVVDTPANGIRANSKIVVFHSQQIDGDELRATNYEVDHMNYEMTKRNKTPADMSGEIESLKETIKQLASRITSHDTRIMAHDTRCSHASSIYSSTYLLTYSPACRLDKIEYSLLPNEERRLLWLYWYTFHI